LYKFGCYGNSLCSLMLDQLSKSSPTAQPLFDCGFCVTTYNSMQTSPRSSLLALHLSSEYCGISVYSYIILVVMATPLARSKIPVAFEFNNAVFTCRKFVDFLQGIEICAILAYSCPNLVAITTPSTPLKIQ